MVTSKELGTMLGADTVLTPVCVKHSGLRDMKRGNEALPSDSIRPGTVNSGADSNVTKD